MNIYLDIDGVLLANDDNLALHAEEFLSYILSHFPDSTYWLTTHCRGDASTAIRRLAHFFGLEMIEKLKLIKPTTWYEAKTEAIDFTKPFLWFDDDCFPDERKELNQHGMFDNWIEVSLHKNNAQLQDFLTSFPLPVRPQA